MLTLRKLESLSYARALYVTLHAHPQMFLQVNPDSLSEYPLEDPMKDPSQDTLGRFPIFIA
jgi:hypothetical protein